MKTRCEVNAVINRRASAQTSNEPLVAVVTMLGRKGQEGMGDLADGGWGRAILWYLSMMT